jgi:3-phenylpropionate/cinnamic acid dioxygenase small subunit
MSIKYEKGSYQLIVDGDTTIINDSITYSGSLIYFNEPNTKKRIFKERNAEMRQIAPEEEHSYIIKDEKGRVLNRYFYEGGILQYATMRHALGNVELKRVNE